MKADNTMDFEEALALANAPGNDLHTGCRRERASVAATASARVPKRLCALPSAPPDLLAFLAEVSVTHAADALGMSRKQVHRLRGGYWPADARKIVTAWEAYRGRSAVAAVVSSWFLRRVQGDVVRHGAHAYTGHRLAEHGSKLLALARTADGGLVAQTLGGQPRMIALQRVEA